MRTRKRLEFGWSFHDLGGLGTYWSYGVVLEIIGFKQLASTSIGLSPLLFQSWNRKLFKRTTPPCLPMPKICFIPVELINRSTMI
jgi:hypothetical protein